MNLRKSTNYMLLSLLVLLSTACTSSTEYTLGYWHQRSDFDGKSRAGAAFFNIDDIEYIVGGGNGKNQRLKSMHFGCHIRTCHSRRTSAALEASRYGLFTKQREVF